MSPIFLTKFIVLWSALASIIIVLAIKLGIKSNGVFILRDSPVYLLLMVIFYRYIHVSRVINYLMFMTVIVCFTFLNYVLLNPKYAAPLNNIRQIIMPIVILFVYRMLFMKCTVGDVKKLLSFVFKLMLFIFLFGLFEISTGFWKTVGLHQYFMLKGIPVDSFGLSYMFYEPMLDYQQRMTSTFLDPISLGHLFAVTSAIAIYGFFWQGRYRFIVGTLSLIGLLLCFSKGAFLQLFLTVVILNSRISLFIRGPMILLPFLVVALLPNADGIMIHLNGLSNSFKTMTLFGHGIGSAGNYAKMFSLDLSTYEILGISDSFIGSVLGQIGLIGFAFWGYALYKMISFGRNKYAIRFLLAHVIVSFMSENTLNVTSFIVPAFFYMLLAYSNNSNQLPCKRFSY